MSHDDLRQMFASNVLPLPVLTSNGAGRAISFDGDEMLIEHAGGNRDGQREHLAVHHRVPLAARDPVARIEAPVGQPPR